MRLEIVEVCEGLVAVVTGVLPVVYIHVDAKGELRREDFGALQAFQVGVAVAQGVDLELSLGLQILPALHAHEI